MARKSNSSKAKGPRPVAQYPLVHKGKVPDVEKVLDHARAARVHVVRPGHQYLVR